MKINQISPLESEFTEVLDAIALKPRTLYYYGKMPENVPYVRFPGDGRHLKKAGSGGLEDTKASGGSGDSGSSGGSGSNDGRYEMMRPKTVAIVGARKNTPYGREIAYKTAYELAKMGVVVVSGLAYGIDSIAHRGAVDAGGVTVAVLGTRINKIYPYEHRHLAEKIVATGGAVMSEYGEDDLGGQGENGRLRFLYRNRLISGLSDVVLVVEAAERSGSLNTAGHALDQGREVFAVPGGIGQVESEGCNNLIAAGAQVFRKTEDILAVLFPGFQARQKKTRAKAFSGSPAEKAVLDQLAIGVSRGDEILARTGMAMTTYNQALTMLEVKGLVRSLGANQWVLR